MSIQASGEFDIVDIQANDRILFLGVGNVGRQDDALGIRLIEGIEQAPLALRVSCEANYQLNVEDALLISDFDLVIFADASMDPKANAPFSVRRMAPAQQTEFTTHAMSFESVLALCEDLYKKSPRAYLVSIPGYEWDINENMSERARENLSQTMAALLAKLGHLSTGGK